MSRNALALRSQHDAFFLVGNELVPHDDAGRVGTAAVTIRGATVRITDNAGNQLTMFTRLTSATVDPSNQGVPGYEPVSVSIVDPNTLTSDPTIQQLTLAGPSLAYVRLVTYTRFFGATLDGQAVESDEFSFPVDVCYGCLITFSNDPAYPIPNCIPLSNSSAPLVPCTPGEDLPTDCSACQGSPICRGTTASDAGGG